jgi:N-acyl-D-amino-acid deacylase
MGYDIVIRGGSIVDGTGAGPVPGDVAIKDGKIVAVGTADGSGAQEIDASGCIVTPGFVDLHTHLDAQIGWDPDLTPVSWHGVTTALMGNCGVTFAPCKPADRPFLASMMETVEDIPRQAILTGLPWTWEDYGGYLDALDTMQPGINVAGLIGHSAVRWYVMNERAFEEAATPDEVAQMARIVGEALDRGALGFSINRLAMHKAPDGRSIPGTFAPVEELVEIGKAVAARGGIMQFVGAGHEEIRRVSDESGARVLFSYGTGAAPGAGEAASKALDALCEGRDVTALAQIRGTGFMFGLQGGLPFSGDTWRRLRRVSFEERLAAIRDPETAAILAEEGKDQKRFPLEDVYYLGDAETPDYTQGPRSNIAALTAVTGETFVELFMRISRETDGKALFSHRMFAKSMNEIRDLVTNPKVYPGLGDAGAHVSQVMDADWSTFLLSHWVRREGLYSLGEAIHRMTAGPARVMGLSDRGELKVGQRADVNVIDYTRLATLTPKIAHDFPQGAARYTLRARGYKATIVNGRVNILDDELTGTRAGMVLRAKAPAMAAA